MKGIIFDMDGTMVDNMMVHHRAWQRELAELGLKMSLEEVKEKIHGVNTEILERLFGDRFSPDERVQISQKKEAAYREIFKSDLKLVDGLPELLDELKSADIPMAIGTAAPEENANFVLDELNLRHYFRAVYHAGSVQNGKPHPEIFIKAASGMNLDVKDCLVFEDSVTGAETAKRAGTTAIIVTTTHGPDEFAHFNHIHQFVSDFRGINLGYLKNVFNL